MSVRIEGCRGLQAESSHWKCQHQPSFRLIQLFSHCSMKSKGHVHSAWTSSAPLHISVHLGLLHLWIWIPVHTAECQQQQRPHRSKWGVWPPPVAFLLLHFWRKLQFASVSGVCVEGSNFQGLQRYGIPYVEIIKLICFIEGWSRLEKGMVIAPAPGA